MTQVTTMPGELFEEIGKPTLAMPTSDSSYTDDHLTKGHAEQMCGGRLCKQEITSKDVTFRVLAARYRSEAWPTNPHVQQSYDANMQYLEAKWKRSTLPAMVSDPGKIETWLNDLTSNKFPEQPLARQTRMHIRMLLHHTFVRAKGWGMVKYQVNPASTIRILAGNRPKPRELVLTPACFNKLIMDRDLPERIVMMSTVAVMTGAAISRVLGLRWEDSIDFNHGKIFFHRAVVGKHIEEIEKSHERGAVEVAPMSDCLRTALVRWRDGNEIVNGWVFGSVITGRPFHASSLQGDYLNPAGEQIGIPNLGWHTFCYTYGKFLSKLQTPEAVQNMFAKEMQRHERARQKRA
jgi:integrase